MEGSAAAAGARREDSAEGQCRTTAPKDSAEGQRRSSPVMKATATGGQRMATSTRMMSEVLTLFIVVRVRSRTRSQRAARVRAERELLCDGEDEWVTGAGGMYHHCCSGCSPLQKRARTHELEQPRPCSPSRSMPYPSLAGIPFCNLALLVPIHRSSTAAAPPRNRASFRLR